MAGHAKFILIAALLISALAHPSTAETVKCAECGMACDITAKFTSRIIHNDQTLYFCDIGDLFSYLKRKKPSATHVEVKDYNTGEWIDAYKAYYVRSGKTFKTPMGWSVASFREKNKAQEFGAAMDFESAAKALK